MSNLKQLAQQFQVIDELAEVASKQEVLECARLLAMTLAHYQLKFGELPLDEGLEPDSDAELNDEQLELVVAGMENLMGYLGTLVQDSEEQRH